MRVKKGVLFLLIALLFLVSACTTEKEVDTHKENSVDELDDNINKTGLPIVKEPIELDFFVGLNPGVPGKLNEISSMEEYTRLSNIKINWDEAPYDSIEEKRNLILNSGNLPDAFYGSSLSSGDIFKYAKQDFFIPLNDLIEKHAPNLSSILEEYPDIKSAITYPDGNIYSLPYLRDPNFISAQAFPLMYFNKDVLDAVDMEAPKTTDEYYEFLKAAKLEFPDITPFGSTAIGTLIGALEGAFGIGNNRGANFDRDPETGDIRFIPTSENYKEMLQYINKLFEEGLIEERIYSIDWNQFLTEADEGRYASTVFYDPETVISKRAGEFFESGIPLVGPHGDQGLTLTTYIFNIGTFVITKENKHPIETIKWADYFYGDEGAKLRFMGIEDLSYEKTNDGFGLTELITNNPDGLQTEEALRQYAHYLTPLPDPGLQKEEYFKGSETAPSALEAVEKVKPYLSEENGWPPFTYTEEENRDLPALETDIVKYVNEMQAQFIVGKKDFAEWDDYVKELESMNLEEYIDIQRAALKRFEELK